MTDNYHDQLTEARRDSAPRGVPWDTIAKYRTYARGLQPSTLNADQIAIMPQLYTNAFSDNILRKILQEHTNRMTLERFEVADDDVRMFLEELITKNELTKVFSEAVRTTLRDGNAVLSVTWRPSDNPLNPYGGSVIVAKERWWDGKSGVWVAYKSDGDPDYVLNEWSAPGGMMYRTVYREGVIERYRKNDGDWQGYDLESDRLLRGTSGFPLTATGVIPYVREDGNPLHPPFVHLANGSDDDSPYGASIFAGGNLAFQDQINAIQHDITAASFRSGNPTTFSSGFELERDSEGNPVPYRVGPGQHKHADEASAKWGTIAPGDLSQLHNAYDKKLAALCRNTATPLHTITGQWPSGEAIFRSERAIVEETVNRGEFLGPAMSSVGHRSTELANAFGQNTLNEDALILTVFGDPELRDKSTLWDIAAKAAPYVSEREILRIMQYTPERIEAIISERRLEAEAKSELTQATLGRGFV